MGRQPKRKTNTPQTPESKVEEGATPVKVANVLKPILQLLPYQRRWMEDQSQLKIVVKGRQTGYSFTATVRAVLRCLEKRTTWIFLSKGERQSRLLMEKVQDHVQSCGILSQSMESQFFEGTLMRQLEVRFPNGSVIYGLPANPDTARGYSGNVTLDEFAFHQDAEKIYTSLYPTITRGYSLEVISTPNGQGGKFFELAKEAGLADSGAGDPTGRADRPSGRWSSHWCDIYKAAREGMKVDIEALRAGVDDETWRQEFCCEFISGGSQWISPELFQQCVSSEASPNFDFKLSSLDGPNSTLENLFAGWDIARHKDASVIWISELVGDVSWTRGVIEMRNMPTPDQIREARALMPYIRRMNIDKSGMGLAIFEALERDFPGKVEGVLFTQGRKEAMAVLAKRRMEEIKVRLPDDDRIRQSFRSVQKTVNSLGQPRFDAEHDAKYGHADHWWAFCMAEAALEQPAYHLAGVGGLVGQPILSRMRNRVF
ncbi:MAG TPA: terminase family protein [Terriglobia bacterium]|nr:terminase family protein [Terriglobia bacterium]